MYYASAGTYPPATWLPAATTIPGLAFPADSLAVMISEMYLVKITSDAAADSRGPGQRKDMEGVVYDYMMAK